MGIFWLHLRPHGTETAAFVYDIEVDAGLRGRGYGQEILSLPFHQHLTTEEARQVAAALAQAVKTAGGAR
ncbi:hypothetical protein [Kitasatospora sp. NPDC089509]|uniref:hypothetical protein n=1 Tax=Kitasatospora sp. NPDC089509 TaxID=3364079 RepID=UPI003812EB81